MAETQVQRDARERTVAAVEAAGGDEELLERVAGVETLQQIADSLEVSRWSLTKYVEQPEREAEYRAAVRASAGAIVDDATELLDNATADSTAKVQLIKERVGHKRWLAGVRDRGTYGSKSKLELEGAGDLGYGLLAALLDYGHQTAPGMVRLRERGELPTLEVESVDDEWMGPDVDDFESPATG